MSTSVPETSEPTLVPDDGPHYILIQLDQVSEDEVDLSLATAGIGTKENVIELLQMTLEQLQNGDLLA